VDVSASDLAKLEEQRVQGLETQGTAILTVVLAIAAFTASTVDRPMLQDDTPAILESWRARRALSAYFAEAKALWVTCSLICLLLTFVSVGVAGLLLVV